MKKLSIIIPAYNEAPTIHLILNKVIDTELIFDIEKEIIVVDDCSTDGTFEAVEQFAKSRPGSISVPSGNQIIRAKEPLFTKVLIWLQEISLLFRMQTWSTILPIIICCLNP